MPDVRLIAACLAAGLACAHGSDRRPVHTPQEASRTVRWQDVLAQPDAWYASPAARAIGESVLAYQLSTGGWPKNIDMTAPPGAGFAPDPRDSTIDNGATVTQIRFLARLAAADRGGDHYREAAVRGVAYLLAAQYPNGGWPQYYPLRKGYYSHITYNDGAMAGVMMLLWDVAEGAPPFVFTAGDLRAKARAAVERGLDVILRTQVRVDGVLTAWGAQHDEVTLEPRPARAFEPRALASAESVGVLRVLLRVGAPDRRVVDAIERGVAWLRAVRVAERPPRWARFYEIGTNRPVFAGRDGVVRYRLEEIEEERQKGYSWYGDYASSLLERQYPAWKTRVSRAPAAARRSL